MRQLWTRAAVIALTAGTLAACESTGGAQYPTRTQTPTPNFPIVQAPPANQQPEGPSTPPDEPQPTFSAPAGNVGVSSQPLAPATTTQPPPPPPPPPVAETRPAPAARPVVVTTVGGPVVTIAGPPKSYKVKAGDNIDAIARTLGTTRAQLAKDNDLKSPYRIHPGLVLQGPETKDAKAYVVQTGDTMFAIAKRFSVTAAALAEANDLSAGSAIRKGQKLRLPEGYRDKGPSRTTVMQPVAQESATGGLPPIGSTPGRTSVPTREVEEDEAPAGRPVTTTTVSVTGPVVEVAGPRRTYTVKRGDNIDAIARSLDTTRADLAKDNDLDAPYRIKPGQKLKGPATTAKAYVVQTGDTLANVAKRFNVKPAALAEENNLRTSAAIRKGQKLRLPSGFRDKGPLKTTVTTTPAAPRPTTPRPVTPTPSYTPPAATTPSTPPAGLPSSPRPYTPSPGTSYPRPPSGPVSAQPVTPPPSAGQIIGSSPPPTEAEITAAGRGRFVWPLQGETISDFGAKGTGQRNDGVNIRAPAGTPVRAAAAGEVVYAGNQVPGFGNLVLVKHADGWVTAYAHLSTTEVKMRQQVAQGATLGAVGQTGGVPEPQLHFEVRYAPTPKDKARPVDPGLVLPR
ncbi:LysM peptidoglycan-binding domain-containing protein [Caulobacter sp. BE254]|uniref:cell division endopeptidase DipM n=1 Tax=Caulobacter sp. BE254 TaxID=2817720 RepID=UPI0028552EF0|nr:LysM peptidoglycan-binding domain-containing protein [Caulobacter sp. BE254]MDR7114836.1 murein DD-endopeptidase MepM/ murein hydrolase activator NlpD [Caulobacter sp. BE254]